jgi:hypothetical protein
MNIKILSTFQPYGWVGFEGSFSQTILTIARTLMETINKVLDEKS